MDFQTPEWVCEIMVKMLPNVKNLVLEPTKGEGNLVKTLRSYGHFIYAPDDVWNMNELMEFDAVVMNPPFTPMDLGYKILYKMMTKADIVIALMPWLTIINSEKRTKDILDFGLKSITHLPRNVFKGSRVQTCILNMEKGYVGNHYIDFIQ